MKKVFTLDYIKLNSFKLIQCSLALIVMQSCNKQAESEDLKQYVAQYPEYKDHSQINFLMNDWQGLSFQNLKTNAIPLKVVVAAIVTKRNHEFNKPVNFKTYLDVTQEYGLIQPQRFNNLEQNVPQPKLEYPVGVVRGVIEENIGPMKFKVEIGNMTCALCHTGRVYDAHGMPTSNVWLGTPNTSVNIQGYVGEIYDSLKYIRTLRSEFLNNLKTVYPNIDKTEYNTVKYFLFNQSKKSVSRIENKADEIFQYIMGPPGSANGIGSFKSTAGIYKKGDFNPHDRGFVNIPEWAYRGFRRNLVTDGIYSLKNEKPFTPILKDEAQAGRLNDVSKVAALFPIFVSGVSIKQAESYVSVMQKTFSNFFSNYKKQTYPGEVDELLAHKGSKIFSTSCTKCHGEYAGEIKNLELVSYPNRIIDIEKIGTDPERLKSVTPDIKKVYDQSWFGNILDIEQHNGYVAPILTNLWYTAPFLHNGSVPTLWDFVNPESRPGTFYVGGHALDFKKVGIAYPQDYIPFSKPVLYDTNQPGYSNRGHENQFKGMSIEDKKALVEFLKLL